jgi:hypothetical protein
MSINLQTNGGYSVEGARLNSQQVLIDRHPNECPVCHVVVMPEGTGQIWRAGPLLECLYHCTADSCHRSFIAHYEQHSGNPNNPNFKLKSCSPVTPVKANFDAEINALSPSFVSIYEQASSAEDYRLEDIAGPGYRKALEFLIKDYAISLHPDNGALIKKLELSKVIKQFLPGDSLPVVSSRAAWLGNDETHYERRWIGKDLSDLKRLILATVHFITMHLLVVGLPSDMPDVNLKTTPPATPAASE